MQQACMAWQRVPQMASRGARKNRSCNNGTRQTTLHACLWRWPAHGRGQRQLCCVEIVAMSLVLTVAEVISQREKHSRHMHERSPVRGSRLDSRTQGTRSSRHAYSVHVDPPIESVCRLAAVSPKIAILCARGRV